MAKMKDGGTRTVKTATGTVTYDNKGRKIGGTGTPPKSTGNTGSYTTNVKVQGPDGRSQGTFKQTVRSTATPKKTMTNKEATGSMGKKTLTSTSYKAVRKGSYKK